MAETSVSPSYAHRDKVCTAGAELKTGGARVKWCEIALAEAPAPDDIRAMARSFVKHLDVPGDLGFVILHRCGGSFYFLLVQTWRNENELWESVYAKQSDADPGFSLFPLPGPHRGTFCVWELGAVWREHQAWRRYLLSDRSEANKQAYLAETYSGPV